MRCCRHQYTLNTQAAASAAEPESLAVMDYIPTQVLLSLSSRKPSLHRQVKLPIVLIHWCEHGESSHSSISKKITINIINVKIFVNININRCYTR